MSEYGVLKKCSQIPQWMINPNPRVGRNSGVHKEAYFQASHREWVDCGDAAWECEVMPLKRRYPKKVSLFDYVGGDE